MGHPAKSMAFVGVDAVWHCDMGNRHRNYRRSGEILRALELLKISSSTAELQRLHLARWNARGSSTQEAGLSQRENGTGG